MALNEKMESINVTTYSSPVGNLLIGSHNGRLCLCDWAYEARRKNTERQLRLRLGASFKSAEDDITHEAIIQLNEYFADARKNFSIPIAFAGSDFQISVWNELLSITYGMTASYTDIANRIGKLKALRAVAATIGANPISIFVPCHRVIGRNGSLTGYAGGIEAKKFLLNHESGASLFRAGGKLNEAVEDGGLLD